MKYNEIINTLRYELNEAALHTDFIHNGLENVFLNLNGKELEEVNPKEELQAIYDPHKSFYHKAYIRTYRAPFLGSPLEQYVNIYVLESYGKQIAAVIEWAENDEYNCYNWNYIAVTTGTWSPTSNRHEAEFFKHFSYSHQGRSKNLTKDIDLDIYTHFTCSQIRKSIKNQLITIE